MKPDELPLLPVGYTSRSITPADIPPLVDLFNLFSRTHFGYETDAVEDVITFYQTPGFCLETDTYLVQDPSGRFAGYMEYWDTIQLHIRIFASGLVHPDYEGLGIGSYLLAWADERAQKGLHRAPAGARVVLLQGVEHQLEKAQQLLIKAGYHLVRSTFHMHIDLDTRLPEVALPEGLVLRPYEGETERRELYHAMWEAFHDHWGFQPEPFEQYEQRWNHNARLPKMDPTMWYLAKEGQQVVGGCVCMQSLPEDEAMGWVSTLGVRRPWRKRGLGLAFLRTAFHEFQRRGKKKVGLGVDAANLTGALRLYEQAGMHVARQYDMFEKVVREGVDLSTQSIEDIQEE